MSNTHPVAQRFLPLAKAAQWAFVRPRTIRRWLTEGLPTHRAGPRTRLLITPSDIEAFLTRQQVAWVPLNVLRLIVHVLVEATLAEVGVRSVNPELLQHTI